MRAGQRPTSARLSRVIAYGSLAILVILLFQVVTAFSATNWNGSPGGFAQFDLKFMVWAYIASAALCAFVVFWPSLNIQGSEARILRAITLIALGVALLMFANEVASDLLGWDA